MKKKEKVVSTNTIIVLLIVVTALILFVVAFCFGMFNKDLNKNTDKSVDTGTIEINYASVNNGISMNNFEPITDDVGQKLSDKNLYFDYTVNSSITGNAKIDYEVAIVKSSQCNLENNFIKVYLEKQNDGIYSKVFDPKLFSPIKKKTSIGTPKGSMIISYGTYTSNAVDKYRLRVWIDSNSTLSSQAVCDISVKVYAKAS